MRYFTSLLTAILCIGLSFGQSVERQVVSSYGGSASSSSVYVSHTAGQPLAGTATSASIILTQGFEQGTSNGVSLEEEPFGKMSIYPNPSRRILTIEVTQLESSSLKVRILDLTGKVVFQEKWKHLNQEIKRNISVDHLASGEYLLEMHDSDGLHKVFQFIKE